MRLINVKTSKFQEFPELQAPRYAILSHTWGSGDEELTFDDIKNGIRQEAGVGLAKLRGCCERAMEDQIGYIWIDTCCIDKTNLVELSEAINSMYRWYQRARVCYAYLSDVDNDNSRNLHEEGSKFRKSRWFRRGWTLQELLAPRRLVFYNSEWRRLGDKVKLRAITEEITGIPQEFLTGRRKITLASVAQRMSWAASRRTTRPEDLAYCLLGLFGIAMPMIYGEGGEQAFLRLQEQIIKDTTDHSILAWGLGEPTSVPAPSRASRFFATSPLSFATSGHIIPRDQSATYRDMLEISGGSLRVWLSLLTISPTETVGLLNCGLEEDPSCQLIGIPLTKVALGGGADEYIRPRGRRLVLLPNTKTDTPRKLIYIRNGSEPDPQILDQCGWAYDDIAFADVDLELVEVFPRTSWHEERFVITPATASPILVRLRHNKERSRDFILILGLKQRDARTEANHCVAICSRESPLERLAETLRFLSEKLAGRERASNGSLNLHLRLVSASDAEQSVTITPEITCHQPDVTIDMTLESTKLDITLEIEGILHLQERWSELQHNVDYSEETCEIRTICGQPPLLWAAENGCTQMVKLLLDDNIDAAAANNSKRTPLIAASDKGHADVVRLLLATGKADINSKDSESGRTLLSWAAGSGHITVAQLLLEEGADVNVKDKDDRSAISYAAEGGYKAMVQLLLNNGATLHIDPATGQLRRTLKGHSDIVKSVAFSHDSKLLASGSWDQTIRIWDPATGKLRRTLEGCSLVNSVAFSHDSKLLASGNVDQTIRVWDPATGQLQQTLRGHKKWVYSVAFSHDSKLLASGGEDQTVRVWDPATGQLRQTLEGHNSHVHSVAFSHDSKLLASGSWDQTIRIWDPATGQLQRTLKGRGLVLSIAFSHDSKLLASGSYHHIIQIWDPATGQLQQTLEGHSNEVSSVAFSHESKLLASSSYDKSIRIWDPATGQLQQTLEGHSNEVCSVAFLHDSKLLASGSDDQTVRIWPLGKVRN